MKDLGFEPSQHSGLSQNVPLECAEGETYRPLLGECGPMREDLGGREHLISSPSPACQDVGLGPAATDSSVPETQLERLNQDHQVPGPGISILNTSSHPSKLENPCSNVESRGPPSTSPPASPM